MFRKNYCFVMIAAALLTVGFAVNARADMIYDFSRVSAGDLAGHDNWVVAGTGVTATVTSGGTGWTDQGKYAESVTVPTGNSAANLRPNGAGWSFSLDDDVAFDFSVVVRVNGGSFTSLGYLQAPYQTNGINPSDRIALGVIGANLKWYLGGSSATFAHGISSDSKFLVGMTVTPTATPGTYSAQPYYQNLSSGTKTPYGTAISWTGTPSNWNQLVINHLNNSYLGSRIDDFRITQVPEPSTVALLACGLVGLLAYAWRKRK